MITSDPKAPTPVHTRMLQRCTALGIPAWWCDAAGRMMKGPEHSAPLSRLFESSALVDRVQQAIGAAGEGPHSRSIANGGRSRHHQLIEMSAGCWLVLLPQMIGHRRIGLTVAMLFDESLERSMAFAQICREADVDAAAMLAALGPIKQRSSAQIRQLAQVLQWTHEDLVCADTAERAVNEFSDKLTQTYEEANMLFRLARLMNFTDDPDHLMQTICRQMHQILPFEWIAIGFSSRASGVDAIRGRLIFAGELAADKNRESLEGLLRETYEQLTVENWKQLLTPGTSKLAEAVGSEVVANPIIHDGKLIGAVIAGNKLGWSGGSPDADVCSAEIQFLDAAAGFLGIFHENCARFAEQQAMFMGTLRSLTAAIDAKHPYTCGHSERVGQLAFQMALALGLGHKEADRYRIAGLVHDVGKIGVPESVLCKAGRLTDEEFDLIKPHPIIGCNILKDIPPLSDVLPGVLYHHERWDGQGYPHKLPGGEIPLLARVLALADSFDAMSSNRSYRPAMSREQVIQETHRCAGTQFDPALVPIFIAMDFTAFDAMMEPGGAWAGGSPIRHAA